MGWHYLCQSGMPYSNPRLSSPSVGGLCECVCVLACSHTADSGQFHKRFDFSGMRQKNRKSLEPVKTNLYLFIYIRYKLIWHHFVNPLTCVLCLRSGNLINAADIWRDTFLTCFTQSWIVEVVWSQIVKWKWNPPCWVSRYQYQPQRCFVFHGCCAW